MDSSTFLCLDRLNHSSLPMLLTLETLHAFVDRGLVDPSFINAVSGIVIEAPCDTGELDGGLERAGNFNLLIGILNA